MCRINCSGGCPECAPDIHLQPCVEQWEEGCSHCICEELADRLLTFPSKVLNPPQKKQGLMVGTCVSCGGWLGGAYSQDLIHPECEGE